MSHKKIYLILGALFFLGALGFGLSSKSTTSKGYLTSIAPSPPPAPPSITPTPYLTSPLGTSVSQWRDWVNEWVMKDAFKRSRPWICGLGATWNSGCTLDLDSDGWVRSLAINQRARTVLFTIPNGFSQPTGGYTVFPTGTYILLYDGEGTIQYSGSVTKNTALSTPGRDVIDATPTSTVGEFTFSITATDPLATGNYIRNIRVIMPGGTCNDVFTYAENASACIGGTFTSFETNYQTEPFHPLFLSRMRRYSTIRYMWWMLPCQVPSQCSYHPVAWNMWPKMTDAHWVGRGVPVELMVELANTLHSNPWFTIPHLASNDFVIQFATYVHSNLDPDLTMYIENANEYWNSNYAQSIHAEAQGLALGLSTDPLTARLRFYSQESVRFFALWDKVFGKKSPRLVRVLSGQNSNSWTGVGIMDWQSAHLNANAYAIAPYLNARVSEQATVAGYTTDQLFKFIDSTILPRTIANINTNAMEAGTRRLELISYEGGQHFVEGAGYETNANMNRIYHEANRDARMGSVYKTLLDGWRTAGGHLFVHFVNVMPQTTGITGRFGAVETLMQSSTPKYDALMQFINDNKKWW